MRIAASLLVVVCACGGYDPVDEVPHREFPDPGAAIRTILAEAGNVQVYAVGEYHPTTRMSARAPIVQFTDDVLTRLAPWADDLVVEAWFDASCASNDPVNAQIEAVTHRATATTTDLVLPDSEVQIPTHGLSMTCIEHSSMLDPKGRVDFYRLLSTIADKLRETTAALVHRGHSVIVYGGAIHNDLYPRWMLEDLSYAQPLAKETTVLELDLAVPEVVDGMPNLRGESWYPLVGLATTDRAILWERGPSSYVLILPTQSVIAQN